MKYRKTITAGFAGFRTGTFGNGGHNIYVSKQGVLQRIHHYDVTANGHPDLIFCNSQNHEDFAPLHVYGNPVEHPDEFRRIFSGSNRHGCVADLNNNGFEDLIVANVWDGMAIKASSIIVYGSNSGLSHKYVNYLNTALAQSVAAGDFRGNRSTDIVFAYNGNASNPPSFKVYRQTEHDFRHACYDLYEGIDNAHIAAIPPTQTRKNADLLIRKKNGAYSVIRGTNEGLDFSSEIELIAPDPDFLSPERKFAVGLQTVSEPEPQAQIINFNGIIHICAFRQKRVELYPYADGKVGSPFSLECKNAFAVAAGDIQNLGQVDLVFAARDAANDGRQFSYLYPGNSCSGWNEADRISFETFKACDVLLHDFTGNGCLDIVICQGHTNESYESKVLVYGITSQTDLRKLKPTALLPSLDALKVCVVNGELVVLNSKSGSLLGNPDLMIYPGSDNGFSEKNRIDIPAWGCVNMVCCDFNDDGFPDLALANSAELTPWLDPGSYVYYNSSSGFSREPVAKLPTHRAYGITAGDFNHNGFIDVVFSSILEFKLKIFHGSEAGFSADNCTAIDLEDGCKSTCVLAADLNGNGYLDLILTFVYSPFSYILWGGPDGFDLNNKQVLNVRNAACAQVADLNNNGYPDLVVASAMQSEAGPHDSFLYIYWGGPEGFSEARRSMLPVPHILDMTIADLNNDGLLDIFVCSYQDGRDRDIDSFIFWNQGEEGFKSTERTALRTHAAAAVQAADFTGNGWIDLAVGNHKVNGCHIAYSTVWFNGPEGFSEERTQHLPTSATHGMGSADLGNIMNRGPEEYYISAPFELGEDGVLTGIECVGDIPDWNWVNIRMRSARDKEQLEYREWREECIPYKDDRWMQYKLGLGAKYSCGTPRITRVIAIYEK